jgi:hypothetical protein
MPRFASCDISVFRIFTNPFMASAIDRSVVAVRNPSSKTLVSVAYENDTLRELPKGMRGFVAVPKMSADRSAQPSRNNYL